MEIITIYNAENLFVSEIYRLNEHPSYANRFLINGKNGTIAGIDLTR